MDEKTVIFISEVQKKKKKETLGALREGERGAVEEQK